MFAAASEVRKFLQLHPEITADSRKVRAKIFNDRTRYRREYNDKLQNLNME